MRSGKYSFKLKMSFLRFYSGFDYVVIITLFAAEKSISRKHGETREGERKVSLFDFLGFHLQLHSRSHSQVAIRKEKRPMKKSSHIHSALSEMLNGVQLRRTGETSREKKRKSLAARCERALL
jgi:hypothetical protein